MLSVILFFATLPGALFAQQFDSYSVKPIRSMKIPAEISEGSGLAAWNGKLWTHNDSGEPILFAIDTSGALSNHIKLPGIKITDWEDISQDAKYLYIGNIGNNSQQRDTLQILRILKSSLSASKPVIDSIRFQWPETRETKHSRKKKINYDCEAMEVIGDSIYLFTKEWKHGTRTKVFSLPAKRGFFTLRFKQALNTSILVTGASYHRNTKKLVVLGHNFLMRPFLLVFPDATDDDFFSGRALKIKVKIPFKQAEGVATFDGKTYYLINERFKFLFFKSRQQLHCVDISKR